jgi:hypothetical protein
MHNMMKTSTPYTSKTTTAMVMATAKNAHLGAPHNVDIEVGGTDQPANMHEFLGSSLRHSCMLEPVMPAPKFSYNNKTDGTTPIKGNSSRWSFPIPKEKKGRWICLISAGLIAVLVVVIGSILASPTVTPPTILPIITPSTPTPSTSMPTVAGVPTPSPHVEVQVQVQHSDYPEETGWTLRDSTGTLISSQSTGSFNTQGGIVTETSSVAPGIYIFEMTDTFGDGICCEFGSGSFSIAVNGETVISNNGQFENIVQETFEVAPATPPTPAPSTSTPSTSTPLTPSSSPSASPSAGPSAAPSDSPPSGMRHVPNTYCEYYESGGDGGCSSGKPFAEVWQKCVEDGSDVCMGVMWNSCSGPTSDTSVNGAWKLMKAGQEIGTADSPTATCGGKGQALGHWDVFVREYTLPPMQHIPNTYCEYYEYGGDGGCSSGKPFAEVWQKCLEDGSDVCMGVMWNSCSGPTSDTSVNGAWKLMKAGQEIGTADSPTATCGDALGHWDVFVRDDTP